MDRMNVIILVHRMRIATKVGEIKRALGLPILNPKREKAVFSGLQDQINRLDPQPISFGDLKSIWLETIKISKKLENDKTLSFLGPHGSHSGSSELHDGISCWKGMPFRTLSESFHQIGRTDLVLLPVENNYSGPLMTTIRLISGAEVGISKVLSGSIRQTLAGQHQHDRPEPNLLVQSHALKQCLVWANQIGCSKKTMPSTAKATIIVRFCDAMAFSNPKTKQLLWPANQAQVKSSNNNRTKFLHLLKKGGNIKSIDYGSIMFPEESGEEVAMMLALLLNTGARILDLVAAGSGVLMTLSCSRRIPKLLRSLNELLFTKGAAFYHSAVHQHQFQDHRNENI